MTSLLGWLGHNAVTIAFLIPLAWLACRFLYWFVRRQLRETAEMACDAMAIELCPDRRREYAEMLLELSAGFKTGTPPPALGVSAGVPSSFERRLFMILSDRVTAKRPLLGVWAACSLGLLALPGWSLGQDAPADPAAVQKQLDEAIKQLEKAVPNAPAEVKKQFEDVRKQLQNLPAANANIFRIGGGNIQMMPAQPIFNIAFPADMRAGRIGAIVQPPDALVATQLQLPANSGQVVVDVVPGQPAAKAGILKHDILLEIAGKTVSNDPVAFRKEIDAIKTDAEVQGVVLRKGIREKFKGLVLGEAKNDVVFQPFPGNLVPAPGVPVQAIPINAGGFGGAAGGFIPAFPGAAPGVAGGPVRIQIIGNGGVAGKVNVNANANGNEATAVSIANDDFTINHVSGRLKVDIKGKRENGKTTPSEITISDGDTSVRAAAIAQAPEKYHATINRLLEGVK